MNWFRRIPPQEYIKLYAGTIVYPIKGSAMWSSAWAYACGCSEDLVIPITQKKIEEDTIVFSTHNINIDSWFIQRLPDSFLARDDGSWIKIVANEILSYEYNGETISTYVLAVLRYKEDNGNGEALSFRVRPDPYNKFEIFSIPESCLSRATEDTSPAEKGLSLTSRGEERCK